MREPQISDARLNLSGNWTIVEQKLVETEVHALRREIESLNAERDRLCQQLEWAKTSNEALKEEMRHAKIDGARETQRLVSAGYSLDRAVRGIMGEEIGSKPSQPSPHFKPGMKIAAGHGREGKILKTFMARYSSGPEAWLCTDGNEWLFYPDDRIVEEPSTRELDAAPKRKERKR